MKALSVIYFLKAFPMAYYTCPGHKIFFSSFLASVGWWRPGARMSVRWFQSGFINVICRRQIESTLLYRLSNIKGFYGEIRTKYFIRLLCFDGCKHGNANRIYQIPNHIKSKSKQYHHPPSILKLSQENAASWYSMIFTVCSDRSLYVCM